MAYIKGRAKQVIAGLEDPVNTHLLKLLAVTEMDESRAYLRNKIIRRLTNISLMRIKPLISTPSAEFFSKFFS